MGNLINITSETFDAEVMEADIPVLVDFWAPWCMPCKMVTPVLEELAADFSGQVRFVKVNTDEQPDIAAKFNIVSIPTLFLFKNGEKVAQHIGATNKAGLEKMINEHL